MTLAELPFQDNVSKIYDTENSLVIWFDIFTDKAELMLFE